MLTESFRGRFLSEPGKPAPPLDIFLHTEPLGLANFIFCCPDPLSAAHQKCHLKHSEQLPQPGKITHWPHDPLLIHHWTPEGTGDVSFRPTVPMKFLSRLKLQRPQQIVWFKL